MEAFINLVTCPAYITVCAVLVGGVGLGTILEMLEII